MSLELIIGPMFSGKSSAVLQRIRRAKAIGREVFIVTSIIDTRYNDSGCAVKTHDKEGVAAHGLGTQELAKIFKCVGYDSPLIIIEEAQFFQGLYDFVLKAVEVDKKDVIVVGLDGDSDRKPFGDILQLIPIADKVIRLTALCKRCGDGTVALFSALISGLEGKVEQIYVGGADKYLPMCRKHYLDNLGAN
jgi:thymidine kinase